MIDRFWMGQNETEMSKDRNCVRNSKIGKTSRFWSLKSGKRTRLVPAGHRRLTIFLKPLITLILKPTKPIRGKTTGI